jgi:hypothetical protein
MIMICEEIVNSVLRRYRIGEPIAEERGRELVKRLRELLDQTRQCHSPSSEIAREKTD